jgi:hypothetical protein
MIQKFPRKNTIFEKTRANIAIKKAEALHYFRGWGSKT